ncbi:MAG TPA: hypothetical protein VHW05_01605 [Phenylobacterium sp.]|nr:hypothetical protein [Phenylobacterium sp.]
MIARFSLAVEFTDLFLGDEMKRLTLGLAVSALFLVAGSTRADTIETIYSGQVSGFSDVAGVFGSPGEFIPASPYSVDYIFNDSGAAGGPQLQSVNVEIDGISRTFGPNLTNPAATSYQQSISYGGGVLTAIAYVAAATTGGVFSFNAEEQFDTPVQPVVSGPFTINIDPTLNPPPLIINVTGDGNITSTLTSVELLNPPNLTLTPAPEPATWTLMLVSFPLMGLGLRRQRRRMLTTIG